MCGRAIANCLLLATLALLPAGCARDAGDGATDAAKPGADTPAEAVRGLTRHLVANDLAAFARDAVPPELHARLDTAWREGRTRWPLDELPFADRHPAMLAALSADGAAQALQRTFDRQFANAAGELRNTAATLGLFGVQYVERQGDFSESERQHFAQLVNAVSQWAITAPLSDGKRATESIRLLTAAARETQLDSPRDFSDAGIDDGLQRMSGVIVAGKQALKLYGLDLDTDLSAMRVTLQSQTGDTAKVRMTYALAGTPIDTVVDVERRDGRWYVSDFVGNAGAAVEAHAGPRQSREILTQRPGD